jgi:cytochrome P450
MISSPDQVNFFDPDVNACPYPAYEVLRNEAPVWKDPFTGMFVVTRHDDIRSILSDPETYTNRVGSAAGNTEKALRPDDPEELRKQQEAAEQQAQIDQMYIDHGWPPVPTLDALDGEKHTQLRRMMSDAFRPVRIKALDPYVEGLSRQLIGAFLADGHCEWVSQMAIPLPLYTIGKQMGVPEADMPRIKAWTDAWVQRLGLMQTMEERIWSAEQEIEGQQYFQGIFDRLREHPEDTVLSDMVNKEIPEWGRKLTDAELHSEMFADIFVGGSETTTNALTAGVLMLIEHPEVWQALVDDTEQHLPAFIEEVVRLEGPVQGLLRETSVDVELHGVQIPAGSVINLRFAAGNRDDRHFECPADIDLRRPSPKAHLGYGFGSHFCLGAPLARRELYWGFKVLIESVESIRLAPDRNKFEFHPNYFLRSMKELHIEFTPR